MNPALEESTAAPHRIRWTRDACARLEAAGVLTYRYELVEGDIIQKMGQNLPHRLAVSRLTAWAYMVFQPEFVQSQAEIDVAPEDNPTSRPEPDMVVLTVPLTSLQNNPVPSQIALLAEVSDSTLRYDQTVKARLYARAGIQEYWILDLTERRLLQYQQPTADGYASCQMWPATATVTPHCAPLATVAVESLLP